MAAPIEAMIDAVMRCTKCSKAMGACSCWSRCGCCEYMIATDEAKEVEIDGKTELWCEFCEPELKAMLAAAD